jgi:hypothetical protein
MSTLRRTVAVAISAAVLTLAGCGAAEDLFDDPHECGPDDIDGDGDGRCNE